MDPTQLAAAKLAYHNLVTGQSVREVIDGATGDRLAYNAANADRLLAYIRVYDPTFMIVADPALALSRPFKYIF